MVLKNNKIVKSYHFRHTGEGRYPEIWMIKQPAVYILASERNGTLYIGMTSDLVKRVWEHKNNLVEGFTKRYNVHHLVWYELHESMTSSIEREKKMKEWKRDWKIKLIEENNPIGMICMTQLLNWIPACAGMTKILVLYNYSEV